MIENIQRCLDEYGAETKKYTRHGQQTGPRSSVREKDQENKAWTSHVGYKEDEWLMGVGETRTRRLLWTLKYLADACDTEESGGSLGFDVLIGAIGSHISPVKEWTPLGR